MSPVTANSQVFDAIQEAKSAAPAFCTNFFPVAAKLDGWIQRGELYRETSQGAAFFFRRDQDFWHWYFSAADSDALMRHARTSHILQKDPVVVDLVGKDGILDDLLNTVQLGGFKRYRRLIRLARPAKAEAETPAGENAVLWAGKDDVAAIQGLLEEAFDRYADQLPTAGELASAVEARQILSIRGQAGLAALLFFETQGVTSTIRYWVVAQPYRANRYGSALIRRYFASQNGARRFVLWVTADNKNAVEKYHHYGYSPDGLIDHVMVNAMIHA